MRSWLRLALPAVLLLAGGCASLTPIQHERAAAIAAAARDARVECTRPDNCALASPLRALAGDAFAESTPQQPRHYATLVDEGEQSLVARLNLIRSASRSIDLQTYIFDHDDSARMVIDALLDAARRGVKVRVLIDQLSAIPDLQILAALAGVHENFSLRIYNPTFGKARLNYFDYAASVVCCFRRFNQRMHNKLLVVDDAIGMVGGRNYQDDYYDWDSEYNFRDRDVMVAGPAVRQMAANFDAFWDAYRSVPVERLNDVGKLLLAQGVPAMPPALFRRPDRVQRVAEEAIDPEYIDEAFVDTALPVRQVSYVADLPQKHRRERPAEAAPIGPELDDLIAGAQHEVILQTPYLVLSDPAQAIFRALRRKSPAPRVIVSTNSLAATDNPIVYAMVYKYKRRNVRELGLDLFEYKPFPQDPPVSDANLLPPPAQAPAAAVDLPAPPGVGGSGLLGASAAGSNAHGRLSRRQQRLAAGSEVERHLVRTETRAIVPGSRRARPLPVTGKGVRMGLHAKSLVVDERYAVVGTHNFDPRSENYNTEAAVVIDDPDFARLLADSIRRDIAPANAWTVAPRVRPPVVGGLTYSLGKASESLPVLDLWPWRYATDYAFQPGPDCPLPLPRRDPDFYRCYQPVGDFPEVNVGPKWLFVRMLTAFGAGLVPIL
ncbi:phospholipase D family protein [Xanthomonas massiliensis]|uniref:phospholipase D family protein n=1 Tax=Xanthomonas massiliensis TaxID=1720302 RepID=UPI000826F4DA|nr:phospholipase D family protein [Xanthomonas massiliensis]